MLRKMVELIETEVAVGFDRGIDSFLETLEYDISKTHVIQEGGGTKNFILSLLAEEYPEEYAKYQELQESQNTETDNGQNTDNNQSDETLSEDELREQELNDKTDYLNSIL